MTIAVPNKFTINVKPVPLIANGEYYSFPKNYTELNELYHFVLVGSIKRVCFLNPKPEYASLDMLRILLDIHDTKLTWYCYAYNPDYFVLDY